MSVERCGQIMVGSGGDTYDPVCTLAKGHRPPCRSTAAVDQHAFPPTSVTLLYCPSCGRQLRSHYVIDETRSKCTKTIHLEKAVQAVYERLSS